MSSHTTESFGENINLNVEPWSAEDEFIRYLFNGGEAMNETATVADNIVIKTEPSTLHTIQPAFDDDVIVMKQEPQLPSTQSPAHGVVTQTEPPNIHTIGPVIDRDEIVVRLDSRQPSQHNDAVQAGPSTLRTVEPENVHGAFFVKPEPQSLYTHRSADTASGIAAPTASVSYRNGIVAETQSPSTSQFGAVSNNWQALSSTMLTMETVNVQDAFLAYTYRPPAVQTGPSNTPITPPVALRSGIVAGSQPSSSSQLVAAQYKYAVPAVPSTMRTLEPVNVRNGFFTELQLPYTYRPTAVQIQRERSNTNAAGPEMVGDEIVVKLESQQPTSCQFAAIPRNDAVQAGPSTMRIMDPVMQPSTSRAILMATGPTNRLLLGLAPMPNIDQPTPIRRNIVVKTEPTSPKRARNNSPILYKQLKALGDRGGFITNAEEFDCIICMGTIEVGDGVRLRECLHEFCITCIKNVILLSDEAEIPCPYGDGITKCDGKILDLEIRAVLDENAYEKYLIRSLRIAEVTIQNTVHCKVPNCDGWCICDDNVNQFICPKCQSDNCVSCQVSANASIIFNVK